jgi:hypothetical protein
MEEKNYHKNIDHKVERNFLIHDRVKAYFKGKWYSGEVIDKHFKEKMDCNKVPYILIKTDEKVDDESDALLNGFGLEGKINNLRTIFEWENEMTFGDNEYHELVEWELSEEEREFDNLSF